MTGKLFLMWESILNVIAHIYRWGVYCFKKYIKHIQETPESKLKTEFKIIFVSLFILSGILGYFGNEHWYMLTIITGVKLLSSFDNKEKVKIEDIDQPIEQPRFFLGISSFVWFLLLAFLTICFATIMKISNS